MNGRVRSAAAIAACLLLAACQTTGGRSTFEAPLRKAGLPVTTAPAGQEDNTAHAAVVGQDGSLQLDGVDYSLADLSPGARPATDTDEAGWWMVMDRTEREVATAGNLVTDDALNAYVSAVACRVAGDHCNDLRVYLINRPAFNATMAPNGMMSVWTGLLLRVRSEAQLATVLGHEFGHYLRRHTLQRMRDVIAMTNGLIFFQIAVGVAGAAPVGDIAALGVLGSIQSYSRDHEREADGYGLLFLYQAGYDVREAAKVWQHLLDERDADPDREQPSIFFSSHPPSDERQKVLAELGAALHQHGAMTDTGRDRFLAATLPYRHAWLRDELNLRQFESTDVLLDGLLDGDPNPAELYFFKGELRRLRNGDGDNAAAIEFYDRALSAAGNAPPDLHRSRGIVLLRTGDRAAAAEALRAYLTAVPDAPDRLIIEQMIERPRVS